MPKEKFECFADWVIFGPVTLPDKLVVPGKPALLLPDTEGQRKDTFKVYGKVLFAGPESKMAVGDEFVFQPGLTVPISFEGKEVFAIPAQMIIAKIVPDLTGLT